MVLIEAIQGESSGNIEQCRVGNPRAASWESGRACTLGGSRFVRVDVSKVGSLMTVAVLFGGFSVVLRLPHCILRGSNGTASGLADHLCVQS